MYMNTCINVLNLMYFKR